MATLPKYLRDQPVPDAVRTTLRAAECGQVLVITSSRRYAACARSLSHGRLIPLHLLAEKIGEVWPLLGKRKVTACTKVKRALEAVNTSPPRVNSFSHGEPP